MFSQNEKKNYCIILFCTHNFMVQGCGWILFNQHYHCWVSRREQIPPTGWVLRFFSQNIYWPLARKVACGFSEFERIPSLALTAPLWVKPDCWTGQDCLKFSAAVGFRLGRIVSQRWNFSKMPSEVPSGAWNFFVQLCPSFTPLCSFGFVWFVFSLHRLSCPPVFSTLNRLSGSLQRCF